MIDLVLTPEQEAEAQRIAAIVGKRAQEEALQMARILASKPNDQLLGAAEFEVRRRAHELASSAVETAVNERKKGGTKGRASSAPIAKKTPDSSAIGTKPSRA